MKRLVVLSALVPALASWACNTCTKESVPPAGSASAPIKAEKRIQKPVKISDTPLPEVVYALMPSEFPKSLDALRTAVAAATAEVKRQGVEAAGEPFMVLRQIPSDDTPWPPMGIGIPIAKEASIGSPLVKESTAAKVGFVTDWFGMNDFGEESGNVLKSALGAGRRVEPPLLAEIRRLDASEPEIRVWLVFTK